MSLLNPKSDHVCFFSFHIPIVSLFAQNKILNLIKFFWFSCFSDLTFSHSSLYSCGPSHTCFLSVPQTFHAFPSQVLCSSFLCQECIYPDSKCFFLFLSSVLCSNIIFSVRIFLSVLHKIVHSPLMDPSLNTSYPCYLNFILSVELTNT